MPRAFVARLLLGTIALYTIGHFFIAGRPSIGLNPALEEVLVFACAFLLECLIVLMEFLFLRITHKADHLVSVAGPPEEDKSNVVPN